MNKSLTFAPLIMWHSNYMQVGYGKLEIKLEWPIQCTGMYSLGMQAHPMMLLASI